MVACWHSHIYRWRPKIRMNEAWRIKYGILVSDKILIFSLFVGCFYHKGPALRSVAVYITIKIVCSAIYFVVWPFFSYSLSFLLFSKNQLSVHKVRGASRTQTTVEQSATLTWRLVLPMNKPTQSVPRSLTTHNWLLFHRKRRTAL